MCRQALDDYLRVLGPSTPDRPLSTYAPTELEEQVECFEAHGFVVIPNMVEVPPAWPSLPLGP